MMEKDHKEKPEMEEHVPVPKRVYVTRPGGVWVRSEHLLKTNRRGIERHCEGVGSTKARGNISTGHARTKEYALHGDARPMSLVVVLSPLLQCGGALSSLCWSGAAFSSCTTRWPTALNHQTALGGRFCRAYPGWDHEGRQWVEEKHEKEDCVGGRGGAVAKSHGEEFATDQSMFA